MTDRCLNVFCHKRRGKRKSRWWSDYGTCSRACAVQHHGSGAIE